MSDEGGQVALEMAVADPRRIIGTTKEELTKMLFELEIDEGGYPPVGVESLWVKPLEDGYFELDNIPFFVRGISFKDVVSGYIKEGKLWFERLVRESAHTTVRILLEDPSDVEPVTAELVSLGCTWEQSHITKLIAVDIPPNVSYITIKGLLDEGTAKNRWEYEEGTLGQR